MRTALVIMHVAFENLGSLRPALANAGYAIEELEASTADLRNFDPTAADLMIILGGPISVYERQTYPFLEIEIALISTRLRERRPTLGICLGAQLIAAAAGARVYPGTSGKEIGWFSLDAAPDAARYPAIATFLQSGVRVLHWHGDTFDLPASAHRLASTQGYANQAFAIGRHTLGLQFHPEVTAEGLERWYVGHACELGGARIDVVRLRDESIAIAPELADAAQRLWRAWLADLRTAPDPHDGT